MSIQFFMNFIHTNQTALSIFGLLTIFYLALQLIWTIWLNFKLYMLSPLLNLNAGIFEKDKWAVVTGSTDGIGRAYAEELANKGLNIVLISRSSDKLNDVAKSIKDINKNVQVKCIVADFSLGSMIYPRIAEQLEGLKISFLVNNVGVSYEKPDYLLNITNDELEKMIIVNCFSVTFMMKLVLNIMVPYNKGTIINIASQSALFPVPLLSVYSATKSYVKQVTDAMRCEYSDKGITFQCVSPGYVVTKLSKLKKSSFLAPDPDTYVKSALATVGLEDDTAGYFAHAMQVLFILALPTSLMLNIVTKNMKSIKARFVAKNQKRQ